MNKFFNPTNKKRFNKDGFVILENFISPNQVEKIKQKVYELYEWEIKKGKDYKYVFDKTNKTKRIWNLVNKSSIFRNLIQNKELNQFMEWIFDRKTKHQKYYLSSFQASILQPGSSRQKIHIDTQVPDPLPPWPMKANSIWMIDDFTEQNGSTEVIPGSHKFKYKPKSKDRKRKVKLCTGKKGSIILTHGNLWHNAGSNKSKKDRMCLFGSFAASYAKEISNEEDHSLVIDKHTLSKASPFLKKILGVGQGIRGGALVKPKIRD